jgi:hypothetical protein
MTCALRFERVIGDPGGPVELTSAVVRLEVRYRLDGATALLAPGSGLVIRDWPGFVITARHVVEVPDGAAAVDANVSVRTAAGPRRVGALAVAYPKGSEPTEDLGVVCLDGSLGGALLSVAHEWPDDGTEAEVRVLGRPDGSLVEVQARLKREAWLLRYVRGSGQAGMSGGPVLSDGGLIGVHLREHFALLSRFKDVLDVCKIAAETKAAEPAPSPPQNPDHDNV